MERDKLIKKYNIDIKKLEEEQEKLAKQLELKDKIDFKLADRFGAIDNVILGNRILSCVIVCDRNFEIIGRAYASEKVKFPYIPGFRAYRELPAMMLAFNKLNEKPDVFFIPGQGIIHPKLGLASHFSLAAGVPSIGISDSIIECEIKNEDIFKKGKKVGKILKIKEGSKPMYVSPGNNISTEASYELSKSMVKLPHKKPEPLHLAAKYAKEVRKELEGGKKEENTRLEFQK